MKSLFAILLTLLILANASPCTVSVVGSGLSGVYTAYRLSTSEDSGYSPNEICLFESSDRLGGRLLPLEDSEGGEVLEMGIEYFDTGKMPLFTELVEFLGLKSDCVVKKNETVSTETTVSTEATNSEVNNISETNTVEKRALNQQATGQQETVVGDTTQNMNQQPTGEKDTVVVESTQEIERLPTGEQDTDLAETTRDESQVQNTMTESPQGLASEEAIEMEECGTWNDVEKLFFIRNQIIRPDEANAENIPFQLKESLDKIKDLPKEAFKTVLSEYINVDEIEAIRDEQDPTARWELVANKIKELADANVSYNGVPIHELNMRMVLTDTLDLSEEEIEAAIYLSSKYPRLRHLMSMNFELFAIQYMRNIAAGDGELRRISNLSGLRTVVDILGAEMKEKGVQIYLNSKLDDAHVTDSGTIIMHFAGIDNVVVSERVFLALNIKNLLTLSGSDFIEKISPEVGELLGSIQSSRMIKGVVFYDDSWWRNYDLSGDLYTDTSFNKLSYHTMENCAEEEVCPGWIRFEHWGTGEDLNYDIVNPVGIATVLSAYYAEGLEGEEGTEKPVEEGTEKPIEEGTEYPTNKPIEEGTEKPVEVGTEKPVEEGTEKPVVEGTEYPTNKPIEEGTEKPVVEGTEYPTERPVEEGNVRGKRQNQPEEAVVFEETEGFEGEEGTEKPIEEGTEKPVAEKPVEGEDKELSEVEKLQSEAEKIRSKIVLESIHRNIMNIHKQIPDFDAESINPPTSAWVANWKTDGIFNFGSVHLPSTVSYKDFVKILLEPISGAPVHFINSDFSEFTDWDHALESSIVQAERALYLALGMQQPEFFDEKIYKAVVEV